MKTGKTWIGYQPQDNWGKRNETLEKHCTNGPAFPDIIAELQVILENDPCNHTRNTARDMIRSYEERGDFTGTKAYEDRVLGPKKDVWVNTRLKVLEVRGGWVALKENVEYDRRTNNRSKGTWDLGLPDYTPDEITSDLESDLELFAALGWPAAKKQLEDLETFKQGMGKIYELD